MQIFNFLELPIITGELNETAEWILSLHKRKTQSPTIISHINANNYYLLNQDIELCYQLIQESYLLFDGIGMKLAAHFLGLGWLPDLNGTDLFPLVMNGIERDKIPIYFLGAENKVIVDMVEQLYKCWPKVNIVGYRSGYFAKAEEDGIVDLINHSGAKILVLGRGFPLQEQFSIRQREQLNVSVIWNLGGLFDFMSGRKKRAPLWIQALRLEWLYRLIFDPLRLWPRTFFVGPWFIIRILRIHRFLKRKYSFQKAYKYD